MRGNNNYTLYVIPVTLYIPLLSPPWLCWKCVFIAREVIAVDQLHRHYSILTGSLHSPFCCDRKVQKTKISLI